ncbi:MAG: O-succinylhomoserine sulfhydrylase [Rubrivivax sp.]|jgi:O-succinylhomoserine sulfhydrylase|nr:O-succinylhomoserine sulfhydrylase [Rubrivivax sp.]
MALPRIDWPEGLHPDTLAIRDGLPRTAWGENSEALFLTSCFVHPDAETAARRFANEEDAFVYSRFSNPNVTIMERRLAALEGTSGCIGTASGMAAITLLVMSLLKAGDHIVCSQSVFGSTIRLLVGEFGKFGVETTLVPQTDVAAWAAARRTNTKLFFAETPTNPLGEICDIRALADLAHEAGALLVVDNCMCSPALQQPVKFGADIVMHSGTKFLDGQGRVIAGALCADEALVRSRFEPLVRTAGMSLSPFNAWVVAKGLETLSVRLHAQSERALELARWLESHPAVARVHYPGLASHPQHALAMHQQGGRGGAVLAFDVKGGRAEAFGVIDATRVLSIAGNFGDVRSIITHPASTTHGRLSEDQRRAAGIGQGLIRLGVGLEHIADLKADLARGLDALALTLSP